MNIKNFVKSSQDYLSNLLANTSFNLENKEEFAVITDPYDLNGTRYQVYPFNKLMGYFPDPEKEEEPVLYTFYILKADQNIKETYLKEVNKMRHNQEYDKSVISSYYANFTPSFKPFDTLTQSLGKMLEEDYYSGKGYEFIFHLTSVTKDYDIAVVYLQLNSLNELEARYPGEAEVSFKI